MFNEKLLESSEFYSKRYQNFTTIVIFPTFILLILLIFIACCTQKETIIKSTGEIAPTKIIGTIQSTSNNNITQNNLLTKKEIKTGELLIQYQNTESTTNLHLHKSSLTDLEAHVQALNILQDSIKQNKNLFITDDNYGCSMTCQNYFSQCRNLTLDYQQQAETKNSIMQQKKIILDALNQKNSDLTQYQDLLRAIKSNTELSSKNNYYGTFLTYKNQISESTISQADKLKTETIINIQQQIDALNDTITTYKSQYTGIVSTTLSYDMLTNKLYELKTQQLITSTKELKVLHQEIEQIKIQLNATQASNKNTIFATESGTVNLLIHPTKLGIIPEGTNIAQIYPNLKHNPDLKTVFYVSASNIAEVSKGQLIRYYLLQKNNQHKMVTGTIYHVSTSSISTKKGNFYQVYAKLNLNKKDYQYVHYGQIGQVSLVTGKNTWISYIKNNLLQK